MTAWPLTLPQAPLWAGYAIEPNPSLVRTAMETGVARQRTRFSSPPSVVRLRWALTSAQMPLFQAWLADDVGFTGWFDITLRLGETAPAEVSARFVGKPRYTPAGKAGWLVDAQIEIKDPATLPDEIVDVILAYGYAETLAAAAALDGVTLLPFFVAWEAGLGV